jgi:gluconokinase
MPAFLLDNQFTALKAPPPDEYAVTVAINQPLVEGLQEFDESHPDAATK